MSFNLEIVSPVKSVFQGEVNSVIIPGTLGSFQVLKNHAPLISSFEIGDIKIESESGIYEFATSGGVFEVKNNRAVVLAESIESKEEVDVKRARLAKLRAEEILKSEEASKSEKSEAKQALQRAENRLKISEKK